MQRLLPQYEIFATIEKNSESYYPKDPSFSYGQYFDMALSEAEKYLDQNLQRDAEVIKDFWHRFVKHKKFFDSKFLLDSIRSAMAVRTGIT